MLGGSLLFSLFVSVFLPTWEKAAMEAAMLVQKAAIQPTDSCILCRPKNTICRWGPRQTGQAGKQGRRKGGQAGRRAGRAGGEAGEA